MFRTCSLLFAAAILLATVASAAPELKFDGDIVSSAPEKLVILAGAQQQEFVISAATKITLNGKEATAIELMPGQTAKVAAEREETKMRAVSIVAFSPK